MQLPSIPALSAVANTYGNERDAYVAECALPSRKVNSLTFQSYKFDRGDAFRLANDDVTGSSQVHEVGTAASLTAPLNLEDHALDYPLADRDLLPEQACGAPVVDKESYATKYVTDIILNNREYFVSQLLTTAGTYAAGNSVTLTGAQQFNDKTNSTPVEFFQSLGLQMGLRPNVAIMGRDVANALIAHPQLRGNFYGPGGALASIEVLKAALGVEKLCIADAMINTAGVGLPPTYVRPFSKKLVLLHNDFRAFDPSQPSASFGYTAVWNQGLIVRKIREEAMGILGGEYIRVGQMRKEVILDNSLGILVTNAIA